MIQQRTTLILFTSAFPYGNSETFLESELPYVAQAFRRVIIVHNEVDKHCRPIPENVTLQHFPYSLSATEKVAALGEVRQVAFWKELVRLHRQYERQINKGIFSTLIFSLYKAKKLKKWLSAYLHRHALKPSEVVLYSYWCNDIAVGIARYRQQNPSIAAVSRAHGWDVYFEVSRYNYLPLRHSVLKQLNRVFFIANYGQAYTQKMNPDIPEEQFAVARLGVFNRHTSQWQAPSHSSKQIRMVSCANVIPLKRLDLLVEALENLAPLLSKAGKQLTWYHFGDGTMLKALQERTDQVFGALSAIQIVWKGRVSNLEILEFYAEQSVDVLVSVSRSEGLPVSMMEAMAYGIPVVATAVGGVAEIVNENNGHLLPANPSAREVADALWRFFQRSVTAKQQMSKAAWDTWQHSFDAEHNYRSFAEQLAQLP